jgi:hypothetical protein
MTEHLIDPERASASNMFAILGRRYPSDHLVGAHHVAETA